MPNTQNRRSVAPPPGGPPRLMRQTTSAVLAAGAATINLPDIPVGHHAYYYRVTVSGQVGGATVSLYVDQPNDDCLLDTDTVVVGGVGSVFTASSRGYQIDPGANLVIVVTGGGAGEAAVNAYYQLVQHYEASEIYPLRYPLAHPAVDAPAEGIVDFYPAHTDTVPRAVPGSWQRPPNEGAIE